MRRAFVAWKTKWEMYGWMDERNTVCVLCVRTFLVDGRERTVNDGDSARAQSTAEIDGEQRRRPLWNAKLFAVSFQMERIIDEFYSHFRVNTTCHKTITMYHNSVHALHTQGQSIDKLSYSRPAMHSRTKQLDRCFSRTVCESSLCKVVSEPTRAVGLSARKRIYVYAARTGSLAPGSGKSSVGWKQVARHSAMHTNQRRNLLCG